MFHMNLIIKANTKEINRKLQGALKVKIPGATMRAINRTGYTTRNDLKGSLPRYIDRPTPFTMRMFFFRRAKLRQLTGYIGVQRIQQEYMWYQIMGGVNTKAKVVPGRTWRLNSYGNLARNATKGANVYESDWHGKRAYWKRRGGKGNRSLEMIGFVSHSRSYRRRYPYYQLAQASVRKHLPNKIRSEVNKILR